MADDYDDPNRLYELAKETRTPMHRYESSQLLYDSSGKPLPAKTTQRLNTLLWGIIKEAFEFSAAAHAKDGGKDIPGHESLLDFVKRRAKELVPDEAEQNLLEKVSYMWGAYIGEPIWRQSLRFAWMEDCCSEGMTLHTPSLKCVALPRAPS